MRLARARKDPPAEPEQETLADVSRQCGQIHDNEFADAPALAVDLFGEQFLARAPCPDKKHGQRCRGEPLHQLLSPPDRVRPPDDHCRSPFGSRGVVTLSASASVLMIRGVRNNNRSVSVVWRALLPHNPPARAPPTINVNPPHSTPRLHTRT